MKEIRKVELEVNEINLADPNEEDFFVRERPIEAVARRLKELSITQEQVSDLLQQPLETVRGSLEEEIHCPQDLLYSMLNLVGLELVAVKDQLQWHGSDGHWYYGERCVYCGLNTYDVMIYGPEFCEVTPKG